MISVRPARPSVRRQRLLGGAATLSAGLLALSACGGAAGPAAGGADASGSAAPAPTAAATPPIVLRTNVAAGATGVAVDKVLEVTATHGTVSAVTVTSKAGAVEGALSADGTTWTANSLLEPGSTYRVRATGVGADGARRTTHSQFETQALSLDRQTYPSVTPLAGQTVGVGMPVIVHFDVPVHHKALFEQHMTVETQPAQQGSWYWISDTEAHWRPRTYWKPGTKVSVHADVNSLSAGDGVYGQVDKDVDFTIGAAHIYRVNLKTDELKAYSNGKLLRTIPVTGGKPGFVTRSGVKVIIEKFAKHTMNSATIGIGKQSPEYYDMKDVQWAMRMTYSGEFLHAAPWSVAYQGHENVSHGCTGMSTADAEWLFNLSIPGDVVEETGTDRSMEFTNGYGDWNKSWKDYQQGSALAPQKS